MRNLVQRPANETGFRHWALRVLNARVSLPSWMLALSSFGLAWVALFLMLFGPGLQDFGKGLPFNGWIWTPLIVAGTTLVIIGLAFTKRVVALKYGAFLSFLMWVFGAVAFATTGQLLTAIVVALPWCLFYAYVYLASFFRDETGI